MILLIFSLIILFIGIIIGCQLHKYLLKKGLDKKLNVLIKERDNYVKKD